MGEFVKSAIVGISSAAAFLSMVASTVDSSQIDDSEDATVQVRQAEISFAKAMEDRDFGAFQSFLADEAIFINGNRELRGKRAIAAAWKELFSGSTAPISWYPEVVLVLESGTLGLSSGPVLNSLGDRIGTFNSVWRRETTGAWKVVFDRGCPVCGEQ